MGLNIGGFDTGVNLPNIAGTTSNVGFWIILILAIVLFLISISIIIFLLYERKLYNRKIVIFENIAGQGYQVSGKDRARIIKIGTGGEEILFLKKRKCYRTAYGRKMGRNTYWFAIGQDGYWYNFLLGDLDAKMGMLDIEPIDRDMRYMHVAIRKNIEERYKKESFMQKYGVMVISSIFLLIMIIAVWLLMSKAGDLIREAKPVADALVSASETLARAAGRLDSLCSGGSGIIPAG